MKITLKQIEVFVAIAKIENMTLASEALFLTQSACSMALASLEAQLGGPLFDRHGKKLLLNERGSALFPKASNIISKIQEIQDLMLRKDDKAIFGNLIIGASTTIGNYVLPTIINDFVTTYPDAKLKLRVANTDQVIQELLKFNIDIGLIEGVCHSDAIEVLPWRSDQLIIIAHPKHPLSKLNKIAKKDLQNVKWILREPGSGTRTRFEEAMGGKLISFFELGHTEAIKQAVQTGLGLSCVSKITVAEALKKGDLIELKTPFLKLTRQFYILLHKEKYRTAFLNEFVKILSSVKM